MPWVFLLLALAAFAVAFKTSSVALAAICLLAALGLLVAWVMGLLAERVGSRSQSDAMIIDPQELRRFREQAEARRAAAANATESPEPPQP